MSSDPVVQAIQGLEDEMARLQRQVHSLSVNHAAMDNMLRTCLGFVRENVSRLNDYVGMEGLIVGCLTRHGIPDKKD